MFQRFQFGLLPVLCATLSACSSPAGFEQRANRADSVRDAGSVHIAVLAVAPWSDYAAALVPKFELTAEQARDQVLRTSMSELEISENRSGIGVSAEQGSDVTPPPAQLPTGGQNVRSVGAMRDRPDAMLEYWTATSLFQEVQLLNRTLYDAAIPTGHRAYLVRLQVSLMPRRRHQPYDVYTTLSFFPGLADDASGGAVGDDAARSTSGSARRTAPTTVLRGGDAPVAEGGPRVLPILVSDNLEVSDVSRSQSDVRRLALSLASFPGDFASNIAADLLSKSFSAELAGRDLNSLLTVARVAENTLRVRLGAMREPTAGYAMVPRNHYVTVLLTVPESAPGLVQILSRTELIDANSGERLDGTTESEIDAAVDGLAREYSFPGLDRELFDALLGHAQRNDPVGFQAELDAGLGAGVASTAVGQALWIEAVSMMAGSRWAATWIELPGQGRWEIDANEFEGQTALAIDNGSSTSVELVGARFAEGVAVGGRLILFGAQGEISLPASAVELAGDERRVRLIFPSLSELGLDGLARQGFGVALTWPDDRFEFDGLYVETSSETR